MSIVTKNDQKKLETKLSEIRFKEEFAVDLSTVKSSRRPSKLYLQVCGVTLYEYKRKKIKKFER